MSYRDVRRTKTSAFALVCALALAATTPVFADGEPMFRGGPALTGVYPGPAPHRAVGVRFQFDAGAPLRNAPAVTDGRLYFGDANGVFRALDARTGAVFWQVTLDTPVTSSPLVADRRVLFTTRDGTLHALSTRNGRELWRLALGADLAAPNYWDFYTSSPILFDGSVYVGSGDGRVYAINPHSGRVAWRSEIGARVRSSPAVNDAMVVVGAQNGNVYAIDRRTGAQRWRFATDGAGYNYARASNDTTSVYASPTIADGVVTIGGRDGQMYGINALTGEKLWQTTHDGSSWILSTAVEDGVVYIGSGSALIVQAADLLTGVERWRFTTNGAVFGSPAIVGDTLIFSDFAGALHAIDRANGQELWHFAMGDRSFSSPVAADGVVYASSDDGVLYALDTDTTPSTATQRQRLVYFAEAPDDQSGWFPTGVDDAIAGYFENHGYQRVDAAQLVKAMQGEIAGAASSVVVFADNHVPSSVLETPDETALLRRYLDAGGAVVLLSGRPLSLKFDEQGALSSVDDSISERVLGIQFAPTEMSRGWATSRSTDVGARWGMPAQYRGNGSIPDDQVTAVLGRDEFGAATAWTKSYGAHGLVIQVYAPNNRITDMTPYANVIEFALGDR